MPARAANLSASADPRKGGAEGGGRRPDGRRGGGAAGMTAATPGRTGSGAGDALTLRRRLAYGGHVAAALAAVVLAVIFPRTLRAQERTGALSPAMAAQVQKAMVSLPAPPAWDAHAERGVWTLDDIKAAFARVTDTPPEVDAIHSTFVRPDAGWLTDYRRWFHTLQAKLDFHYEEQVWDCDNYANCFVAFADLLALRAGETRGRLCVGWASVYYETPFAGIGRGAHAVVIVGTREGLFVIEPQDGTTVPLREFPNRDTIVAVYF